MARKVKDWTAVDGRDKGRKFRITEMPSFRGEDWAIRMGLALGRAGLDIPEDDLHAGAWATLAAHGLMAILRVKHEDIRPLLEEMTACVQYIHAAGQDPQPIFMDDNCQIEEVATWIKLRIEILELHAGFSLAGLLPSSEKVGSIPAQDSQ